MQPSEQEPPLDLVWKCSFGKRAADICACDMFGGQSFDHPFNGLARRTQCVCALAGEPRVKSGKVLQRVAHSYAIISLIAIGRIVDRNKALAGDIGFHF